MCGKKNQTKAECYFFWREEKNKWLEPLQTIHFIYTWTVQ